MGIDRDPRGARTTTGADLETTWPLGEIFMSRSFAVKSHYLPSELTEEHVQKWKGIKWSQVFAMPRPRRKVAITVYE